MDFQIYNGANQAGTLWFLRMPGCQITFKKKNPPKMVPLPATSFSFGKSQDDTCIKGADQGSKPGHVLESEIILNVLLIFSRKQVNL